MIRDIIKIDEEKCIGCSLCVNACHEGAIQLIDGKAKLISDSYCDGLGACLPSCPTEAITIEKREAEEFNEALVEQSKQVPNTPCGCPGSQARTLQKPHIPKPEESSMAISSNLAQWPCQIKLIPVSAPYFDRANLLVAADCAAYAYANFHTKFMENKVTIIGCPKLDEGDYSEKLASIIKNNDIKSLTIVRMEVPCCGGLENAAKKALMVSGKMIPWNVVTLSISGEIIDI